ncbi:MAG: hypothetical protein HY800_09020 [Ignavibacteriales bacterium]|nr:hypothetical protein [Ignavibacteriales bacterium]
MTEKLLDLLEHNIKEHSLTVRQSEYGTIAKLHDFAEITDMVYEDNLITVRFRINHKNLERLEKLLGRKIAQRKVTSLSLD